MKKTTMALHGLNVLALVSIASSALALRTPQNVPLEPLPVAAIPEPDKTGLAASARPVPRPDTLCLALNAYFEARGEDRKGMAAVTQVAINRTARGYRGARTACETVFMRKQFSWTHEGLPMPTGEELKEAREVAAGVYAGRYRNRVGSAHLYYNPKKVDAWWAGSYTEVTVIGNHRFME